MKKVGIIVLFDVVVLMLIGLIMVLSASSSYSAFKFDSIFHLFASHAKKVGIAFGAMLFFSAVVPYSFYKKHSKKGIFFAAGLLAITLIIGSSMKGAGRWLNLGIFSFQPADVAKLFLIVHIAALIESKDKLIKNFKEGFIYIFFWVIVIAGLIIIQPNVSNAVLLVFICLSMMYVGGAKITHLAGVSLGSLLAGASAAMLFSHSRGRILTFIKSVNTGSDINIQVKQAILGLGSGGWIGVGMGHSRQNNLFLPEAYGDFIFAIFGEETGFIGAVILLLCYLVLFAAGILIAKKAQDKFGQLLAFGITFSITIYAFINIAVASGLLPTTGLPLPFISYGGTSIIFLAVSVGVLVNIAFTTSKGLNVPAAVSRGGRVTKSNSGTSKDPGLAAYEAATITREKEKRSLLSFRKSKGNKR